MSKQYNLKNSLLSVCLIPTRGLSDTFTAYAKQIFAPLSPFSVVRSAENTSFVQSLARAVKVFDQLLQPTFILAEA